MAENIVLTGFMGVGKTNVGRFIAGKLEMKFVDTDALIEEIEGRKIKEIFSEKGEKYFREIEKRIIEKVSNFQGYVISTGGGVVLSEDNISNLSKNGIIFWLKASPETIYRNVINTDIADRPVLKEGDVLKQINKLLKEREEYYENAHFTISVDEKSIEEIAGEIISFSNKCIIKKMTFIFERM